MNLASDHSAGRTVAALLGSLPLSLATSIALARLLPLGLDLRFTIGFFGFFVLWPAAICLLFLARSGARAWGAACALTALAIVLVRLADAGL